ncbi:MAG: hypothetical protein HQM04_14320 [Magnetococcales bacterium]|nr:hypothetical protein [Magnetococcales bacterium]MBF0116200.1 hypothetical protein [Magnetococcales bacterium]
MHNSDDLLFWEQQRGLIRSRKGGWIVGKGVYCHHYSLMDELIGRVSYVRVMVLNATGRLPGKRLGNWFEASLLCTSWPDARIWCNQIGAFGGTVRVSPAAATMAGTLAADSMAYGVQTIVQSQQFIQQALAARRGGQTIQEIVEAEFKRKLGKGYVTGYSRPIASGDLRLPAMERIRKRLGFAMQAHLRLAFKIGRYLDAHHGEQINTAGYLAAFLADRGYSTQEVYRIYASMVSSGVLACFADTDDRPAEAFLPLRCVDVQYTGKPRRVVPECVDEGGRS